METRKRPSPAELSNEELVATLDRLARCESRVTAVVVAHLAELDRRELHTVAGFRSLHEYCTGRLHLSDHEAYLRITAARMARAYPRILELLASGELHLTAVKFLAPCLVRSENPHELIEAARHKTSKQVALLVAQVAPKPDVRDSVRKLPTPKAALTSSGLFTPGAAQAGAAPAATPPPATPARRPVVAPLSLGRYKVEFTATEALRAKLVLAQELLGRRVGHGDLAAVVDQAVDLLIAKLKKEKYAATTKPRPRKEAPSSAAWDTRNVPAEVRRQVAARDGEQCAYAGPDGRRCTARTNLEFHHHEPHALGGRTSVENLSIRCRVHNVFEAQRLFGPWRGPPVVREAPPPYEVQVALRGGNSFRNEVRHESCVVPVGVGPTRGAVDPPR